MQKCSALTCIKISEAEMKYSIFPTIFYRIMKRNLGNVEYDADAALYPGASYQEETDMFTPEILLVDGDDELLDDAAADDKKLLEARMIAKGSKSLWERRR